MAGRITRIWEKPLGAWTLLDLVGATLLISLVSIACGIALAATAVIPAAVPRVGRGQPCRTAAAFKPR